MKLSMSLLSWYMREYNPTCYIQNDSLSIEGIRFHQDETHPFRPEYLYFSHADIWFEDPKYSGAYLAAHGQSTLFFWNCDYDELLNSLLSAFDYFNTWEGRLLDAAARQAPVQQLLEIGTEVLQNPATIADFENVRLATVDKYRTKEDLYWQLMSEQGIAHPAIFHDHYFDERGNPVLNLSEKPMVVQNVLPGGSPVMMMYLTQGEEPLGGFVILLEHQDLIQMNQQLAPMLARYFVKAKEFTTSTGLVRSSSQIFQDLLNGNNVGSENLRRLSERLPNGPFRLLVLHHETRKDLFAARTMAGELRNNPRILMPMLWEDGIVALIRDEDWKQADSILHLYNYCAAASMPFSELISVLPRYRQAKFTLEQAKNQTGFWSCEDFAFDYLLSNLRQHELSSMLIHPAMDQLEHYDRDNQTELRPTLSHYLECNMSLTNTASNLHVHINTLKYRLRRIRELTGLTLTDSYEIKYLRLSDWLTQSFSD